MATRTTTTPVEETQAMLQVEPSGKTYNVVSTWQGAFNIPSANGEYMMTIEPGEQEMDTAIVDACKDHPAVAMLVNMGIVTFTPALTF